MKYFLTFSMLVIINVLPLFSQQGVRNIRFTPTSFSNSFSLNKKPVLHIQSGDTVSTETIDAFGRDRNGIKRQGGGNPLTGPFYIDSAQPGDVLAITLHAVTLNRPYAFTTESFVSRGMPDSIAGAFKKPHIVKWKLDLSGGFAFPDSSFTPYDHLKDFKVPLHPFLGCIGVAPANKHNEILSFFQGPFGGNLDFSSIGTGAIVYLPVFHEGGFFYIGDGHAVQGDGEIAGNALETSMDVVFSIKLIKAEHVSITYPRIENADYLMATGTDKSLDKAIKKASVEMLNWLRTRYGITVAEATQVMSTTLEYTIAEIADPEVVVVAKIKKALLAGLKLTGSY